MCKKWGETPFFEIQETEGGHGTVLRVFPDEHIAWGYFNRLKKGEGKSTWGGEVRLIEIIEIFGDTKFTRHAHTGWEIQDTNHPGVDNGINVIHLTPDAGYIYDAWDEIIGGFGEYKNFKWNGNLRMVRVVAVHK
jgi:hypothetical protein